VTDLSAHVRDIPDWPRAGVTFKDITPLLADRVAFTAAVEALVEQFDGVDVDKVLGIEARGFIFAAPVALHLGAGFVPVRKGGKLPWHVETQHYDLEYGTDLLEIHRDAVGPGERVLVVDDVLATGGTVAACIDLVEKLGGEVLECAFLMEIEALGGRKRLAPYPVTTLLKF
jgi:adenine phosphoribosyltransferase